MHAKKPEENNQELVLLYGKLDKNGKIYFAGFVDKPVMVDLRDLFVLCVTDIDPVKLKRMRSPERTEFKAKLIFQRKDEKK